ncbi:MAG: hypothetical protein ACPGLV_05945, partial [Bacteroidia bacterium]
MIRNKTIYVLIFGFVMILSSCQNAESEKSMVFETIEAQTKDTIQFDEKRVFETIEIVKSEFEFTPAQHQAEKEGINIPKSSFFRSTENQLDARLFDVCLSDFSSSECIDERRTGKVCPIGLFSIIESEDYFRIELGTSSNCCYGFMADVGVYNDSTLNLIYH